MSSSTPQDPRTTQLTQASTGRREVRVRAACLVVIRGEGLGRRIDLRARTSVVGRESGCDLQILHPSVSRRHCEIRHEDGRYYVRDLGSTNATRLNDTVVERAELSDGDHLVIGESIVKFVGADSIEASYHEEIHELARRDELTSLFNRRMFIELFERELALSQHEKLPLTLAILDIDWFKRINDTCGHGAGDRVLRQVAQTIEQALRPRDIVARIGGEEFALLIPGLELDAALAHADAIRIAVQNAEYFLDDGQAHRVTISIGLALRNAERDNRSSLLRAADVALYQAKQGGRNRCVVA